MFEGQVFQFMALPFGMSLSLWIFTKLIDVLALHLCQRAVSVFPYLGDWLIRDLISNRLISSTKSCLQIVQSLGFISNLKKSDVISAQKFMFFLTQQNIVRVPQDQVDSILLTIKRFFSQAQVTAQTYLSLLGKLSAAADFVVLGRLHLCRLQMCLVCLDNQSKCVNKSTDKPIKTIINCKTTASKILLIGDSVLSGINKKGLNKNL